MTTSPSQVPVGLKVGEYEITGFLGEGGMGKVYAGIHPVIGKKVAIKVLSPELGKNPDLIARFIQEARAVNQIGHPNIIDVFAFGESPDLGHYFVMPLLSGESLAERLSRGPLPVDEATSIFEKVVEALAAAHSVGIYHRDLKPDNIFLASKPGGGYVVKVLDFGIAKLSDGNAMTVTKTGVPMGTPMFMSPEQWEGVDVDHRTDIYALGVLLHHMVTGDYPFKAATTVALMRQHCDAQPALPSMHGAPTFLDPVCATALAKNRDRRYQTTVEMYTSLRTAIAGGAVPMPRPPTTQPSGPMGIGTAETVYPGPGRSKAPWFIAAVVLLGAGGAVMAVTLGGGDDEATAAAVDAAPAVVPVVDAPPPIDAAPVIEPDAQIVERVEISLRTTPRGADIIAADGEILGTTPATIKLPKGRDKVELTLRKAGRADKVIKVVPSRDRRYATFRLKAARHGTRPGTGRGSGSGGGSGSGSGTGSGSGSGSWGTTGNPFGNK